MPTRSRAVAMLSRDTPFLITLANTGAMVLALASAPIVARAIGSVGRGETAAALAAFAIVPIVLGLGVPLEVRRQAAKNDAAPVVRTARDLAISTMLPAAGIAAILDLLVFGDLDASARVMAFAGIVLAPFTISVAIDASVLVARGRYRGVLAIRLVQPVLFLVLSASFWLADVLTVTSVLAVNLLASVLAAVVGWMLVRVPVGGDRTSHRALLRSGLHFAGSSIAETASNRLDQVLVLPLIGAHQAGLYSLAVTVGSLPLALGYALGASLFRELATADGGAERMRIIREGLRSASSITIVACVALAAVTPFVVPFVFGQDFDDAVLPTLVVLIGSFGLTVGYVCSMMLVAEGRGLRMTAAQCCALAVAILLLYLLAPAVGAVGAGIASSVSYLLLLVILFAGIGAGPAAILPTPRGFTAAVGRLFR